MKGSSSSIADEPSGPSRITDQMPSTTVNVHVPGNHLMTGLLGHRDELLLLIEDAFPEADVHVRGNEITVSGDQAGMVGKLFEELVVLLQQGQVLEPVSVRRSIEMVRADQRPSEVLTTDVLRNSRGRMVRPKTSGQKKYIDAIRKNIVTFGVGPAGTGKSWLAVAMAVQALQAKEVERIILTRPAVEAGERLGFLPGDMMAKVDPYLRPLYDALYDMLPGDYVAKLLLSGEIEVAPLAFMRGRTLSSAFIILDEAQNTTTVQMKMALTRMGEHSRMVVTGDLSQVDLPRGVKSGLEDALETLDGVEGIGLVRFTARDVVRHDLVTRIVSAYDKRDAQRKKSQTE